MITTKNGTWIRVERDADDEGRVQLRIDRRGYKTSLVIRLDASEGSSLINELGEAVNRLAGDRGVALAACQLAHQALLDVRDKTVAPDHWNDWHDCEAAIIQARRDLGDQPKEKRCGYASGELGCLLYKDHSGPHFCAKWYGPPAASKRSDNGTS